MLTGLLSNVKLVVGVALLLAFAALFGAYKIKSYQLDQARAALATEQANNASLTSQVASQQQNQVQVQASQERQQARAIIVGEIREKIVEVKTSELTPIEIDLCALITRLYNGLLVKSPGSRATIKNILPKTSEGSSTGAEGHKDADK